MAQNDLDLSIVIPAYNEENRLPVALNAVIDYFQHRPMSYEVIVVDDGSKDNTVGVVQTFSQKAPQVRLVKMPQNSGKGAATCAGVMAAIGSLILYQDADGASPIEEIERLLREIEAGAHVAIGSRALFSAETEIHTVWYRKIMGRTFNTIVNLFVVPGIADTQCGFKMFKKQVAQYIFPRLKATRFSFDVELLYLARKMGCLIAEVPINWNNVPGSKVNLVSDSADMFWDVIKIPFRSYGRIVNVNELQ